MSEKKTATAMNNELRATVFADLLGKLADLEPTQIDATTVAVPTVREDGTELYYSVKLTLHKEDFDLDEKVAEYADKVNERDKKAAVAAEKKAATLAKKAEREAAKAAKEKKAE